MKVLLVEDDPAIARSIVYTLERDGMSVTHCLLLGDARRQLVAFLVYVHRLAPRDPLRRVTANFETEFAEALLPETPVAPDAVQRILTRLA